MAGARSVPKQHRHIGTIFLPDKAPTHSPSSPCSDTCDKQERTMNPDSGRASQAAEEGFPGAGWWESGQ